MNPGDLIGFKTTGFFAWFIRFGQRLMRSRNWEITHVGVVSSIIGNQVEVIESARVIDERYLSDFEYPWVVIPSPLKSGDSRRLDGVAFARSQLGRKYGVLSVISRGFNCITPKWVRIGINRAGDMDCSCLAARVFEHQGVEVPWPDPWQVTPAQLADEYG